MDLFDNGTFQLNERDINLSQKEKTMLGFGQEYGFVVTDLTELLTWLRINQPEIYKKLLGQ